MDISDAVLRDGVIRGCGKQHLDPDGSAFLLFVLSYRTCPVFLPSALCRLDHNFAKVDVFFRSDVTLLDIRILSHCI